MVDENFVFRQINKVACGANHGDGSHPRVPIYKVFFFMKVKSRGISYRKTRQTVLCIFLGITTNYAFADTAFQAVQVLKAERGLEPANAVCEIRGERGGPDPKNWVLLLNDPRSRSGVREIVVSGKKIISDRTPIAEYGGVGSLPILNTESLRLDSSDAFRIANKEAANLGVGFHWLDYKLIRGDKGAIWRLYLTDYLGNPVGNILISADTGAILRPLQLDPDIRSSAETKSEWVREGGLVGHASRTASNVADSTKKTMDKTGRFIEKTAVTTQKKVKSVAGDVQEWLTGKRTVDPDN
ncbi:MAG: hypothetical protein C5B47_00700 [Verrucomicrobia bacterium]|nr:MAG: hypothetical protein C5B47_00700 [Verrucomicrobiota bacterium]